MEKKQSIGTGLLFYCLMFTLPWLGTLITAVSSGKPIAKIAVDTFYYIRLYKISFLVSAFSCVWLAYMIASIGIIKGKAWGRILGIYSTGIMTIWSFGYWLYAIYNDIVHPVIFSGNPAPGFGAFMGFIILIIPIGLPSLIFLILLTRPQKSEGTPAN